MALLYKEMWEEARGCKGVRCSWGCVEGTLSSEYLPRKSTCAPHLGLVS